MKENPVEAARECLNSVQARTAVLIANAEVLLQELRALHDTTARFAESLGGSDT
jgi:hypothetical protein